MDNHGVDRELQNKGGIKMASIHNLLSQVPDAVLRTRLEEEYLRAVQSKKFGLVFEDHVPECTPLYGVPIRCGSVVARKLEKINELFIVVKILSLIHI